jgi:hypothetical protein
MSLEAGYAGNQMGFIIPPVNTQALGSGISATYHASGNVAVIHPDFFASNRIDQLNVVAHEYLHSLPENRALVSAATAQQATSRMKLDHGKRRLFALVLHLRIDLLQ